MNAHSCFALAATLCLGSLLSAAAPGGLRLLLREDAACPPEDRACVSSRLYVQPESPQSRLAIVSGARLKGLVALPRPKRGTSQVFEVPVRLIQPASPSGGRFKLPYLEVALTAEESAALLEYVGNLPDGGRYEPILEIKNILVDDEPVTFTAPVPVGLTLQFSPAHSQFSAGVVGFAATYLPGFLLEPAKLPESWAVGGGQKICGVEYRSNLAEKSLPILSFGVEGLEENGTGALTFSPLASRMMTAFRAGALFSAFSAGDSLERLLPKALAPRPARQTRLQNTARRFRYGSPVKVTDFPLYLRVAFLSSGRPGQGRDNTADLDLNFNTDPEADTPSPVKPLALGSKHLTLAPALRLKMNNVLNADNENSLVWFAPVNLNRPHPAKCRPECQGALCCDAGFFSGYTLRAGLRGEHAGFGQNQNLVVPFEGLLRFRHAPVPAAKKPIVGLDLLAGFDLGQVIDKNVTAFAITGDETTRVVLRPRLDQSVRRAHAQVSFSVIAGKKNYFSFTADGWRMFRPEQYLDKLAVKGQFTAERPLTLPDNTPWGPFGQAVNLFVPQYRQGARYYLNARAAREMSDNWTIEFAYARGSLPPAFQMVDKFTVGIAFQIKP